MLSMHNLSFVEYFAGIGLVRLGLEKAGWKVVYGNDFDPRKKEMYESYFPNSIEYDSRNIFDVKSGDIPYSILATSSFPCIDLSLAGKQNGINGNHSSAFWGVINVLSNQGDYKPPIVMFENVPGWLTSNSGQDFRITVKELNRLGYQCDVFSIDALRFTPQSRERIFLIGFQGNSTSVISNQNFDFRDQSLKSSSLVKAVAQNSDLGWGFLDVPGLPSKRSTGLKSIIENMAADDDRWWKKSEVLRHLEMMESSHSSRVQHLISQNTISYRTVYRRKRKGQQRAEVRKGDTAGCLRTAVGGSSRQIVIKAGKGEIKMRHMTPREYARLQGVPDKYPIPDNTIQALTGFGDAVAVPVISWIGENILNPLATKLLEETISSPVEHEYR